MLPLSAFFIAIAMRFDLLLPPGAALGDSNCPLNVTVTKFETDDKVVAALQLSSLDESTVAREGHADGVKPDHYNLSFNFLNKTHYDASVNITFEAVRKTKFVVVNRHYQAPFIDYEKIELVDTVEVCVRNVHVAPSVIVVELSKQIGAGERYTLSIPSFHSFPYVDFSDDNPGSIGWRAQGSEEQGYWASTTIFQMRYARTMFPCFDHPSLKANFSACVEHPANWMAASNTPVLTVENYNENSNSPEERRTRHCFETTPKISTYIFTIGLMENYTLTSLKPTAPERPVIDLYAPTKKLDQLSWILNASATVVDRLSRLTGRPYVLPRLGIFVTFPAPFWGVENYGLITVEGSFMEMGRGDRASMILYHELVHQWVGDLFTISEWKEICLQEGLTAFVEWKLSEEFENKSMQSNADQALGGSQNDYWPFLRRYNLTQDIADHCFGKPPVFYYTLAEAYGFGVYEKFLNKMVTEKAYGSANMQTFDSALTEAVGEKKLEGYLTAWFNQSGFAYVFASKTPSEVTVRQGRVDNLDKILVDDSTVRPFPVDILIGEGQEGRLVKTVVPGVQNHKVILEKAQDAKWFLMDPDRKTATRKVYLLENYDALAECTPETPSTESQCSGKALSTRRLFNVWSDFCKAIYKDAIPWGIDDEKFDGEKWKDLFKRISNSQYVKECKCCLTPKKDAAEECRRFWDMDCGKLRLAGMLGFNGTSAT